MDSYYFRQWANIDTFVYFGHHLLTIPPPGFTILIHRYFMRAHPAWYVRNILICRLGSCCTSSRCPGENPKSTHDLFKFFIYWLQQTPFAYQSHGLFSGAGHLHHWVGPRPNPSRVLAGGQGSTNSHVFQHCTHNHLQVKTNRFVTNCVDIAVHHGLQGWLVRKCIVL